MTKKKKQQKSNTESESESETKSKIEKKKKKKKTTTKSKAATAKGKLPCWNDKRKFRNETYEEYWKRENDNFIACLAKTKAYEAAKEKHEIQEFHKRCESFDFCFIPSEGRLIDYYLRSRISNKQIAFSPIEEVDIRANHPQGLIEHYLCTPGKVGYFFTQSRLDEIQSGTDIQGSCRLGEKEDVLYQGNKVGSKQVLEYCKEGHTTGYKIIQYQLEPVPVDQKAWFVCKLWDGESSLVGQNQA